MSPPVRHVRRWLTGLLALAAVLGVSPAFAQDAATIKRLEQMNKRAMEDYDLLEFDSARKTLTDAVALVRSSGIEDSAHGIAAKTYINLGVVYIGGFKDKDRGRMQFVRALKIKPDSRLDPQVATPELQEVFNDALREMGKKPVKPDKPPVKPDKPPVKPDKPDKPAGPAGPEDIEPSGTKVEGLAHEPINEARSGFPIVVKAEVGADVTAGKVLLFYRGTGREDYLLIPMTKNRKGVYVAQIPADQVTGKVLQYYLEVRDNRGRPQVANGSAGSPNIISIVEATGDGSTPDGKVGDDGEDPLKRKTRITKKDDKPVVPSGPKRRRFWITAAIGTGFGLAYGYSECAWNEGQQSDGRNYSGFCVIGKDATKTKISPGFATAPLHVAPEFGYYITEKFALSLQGRFQVLTLADPGAATAAPAGVLRGLYFFGSEKFRYYLSFALGGGIIRHTVPLGKVATKAEDPAIQARNIKDTVFGGYVLFGPGFGITYEFSKYVGLMVELNAWAGVPKVTFNLDVNAGLTLNF
jgi:hypothetical protein